MSGNNSNREMYEITLNHLRSMTTVGDLSLCLLLIAFIFKEHFFSLLANTSLESLLQS